MKRTVSEIAVVLLTVAVILLIISYITGCVELELEQQPEDSKPQIKNFVISEQYHSLYSKLCFDGYIYYTNYRGGLVQARDSTGYFMRCEVRN